VFVFVFVFVLVLVFVECLLSSVMVPIGCRMMSVLFSCCRSCRGSHNKMPSIRDI